MRLAILGSGSSGNAVVVVSGGRRILLDAGFSCREIEKRLKALGEDAAELDALLLTHDHADHVRGAARLVRRHRLPLYATGGTLQAAGLAPLDGASPAVRVIRSGEPFVVAGFRVEPFRLPHDAAEPVGFVIEDEAGCRLGLLGDLGCRSQLAWGRLRDLDCLILETNHDLGMLRGGPYPWFLKQRIAGRHGHLSNGDAAAGVVDLVSERLRRVVLYHLSRTNNQPALALATVGEALDRAGAGEAEVVVSHQHEPTAWLEVTR
ncbi:MAG: MBL fold metallo-hydrolase [Acidobacteria bacterium]|nr:MAG: MBL fold metallo-hydrolase [Acidobacteriota bacterium]